MMRARCLTSISAFTLLVFACSGGGGPFLPDDDSDRITVDPRVDGSPGAPDASTDSSQGTTNPGGTDDGGLSNPDANSGPQPPTSPTLDQFEAYQTGRNGQHVGLVLGGTDPNRDVVSFVFRFLDERGVELMIVDSNLDGAPDSGYMATGPVLPMDADENYQTTLTMDRLFLRFPHIASVDAFALDVTGRSSEVVSAALTPQIIRSEGESCNSSYIGDRCADGLGCKGTPSICSLGEAPSLVDFAYQTTSDGFRIRAAGTDPDDDIWRVVLNFQDLAGNPVQLDLDNDGQPDSSTFEIDATGRSADGSFFVEIEPTQTFADQVQRVSAVPVDAAQRQGNRIDAPLTRPTTRRVGETCDPYGFDSCRANDICYPGVPNERNICTPLESIRRQACMNAPVLSPNTGVTRALGVALGASLWDPPAGCAALDPKQKPDAAVNLDLPNGARRVTLSTGLPGTGFNTILYVIKGCESRQDPVLGCQDNAPDSITSELVLEDLEPGRYLVVIDAWNIGGAFEVEATIEL